MAAIPGVHGRKRKMSDHDLFIVNYLFRAYPEAYNEAENAFFELIRKRKEEKENGSQVPRR